jgi:hypothetical protein
MRTQIKKRQRNRRIIILGVVVIVGVVIIIGAFLLSSSSTPLEKQIGQPVSPAVYQAMYASAQTSYGNVNQTLMTRLQSFSGQPFMSGTKPVIVYIGADYCPYCAFQRWPLVMALMRFGNFSSLDYMLSSSTDVFPNSATFTFYGSKYTSNYVVFQGYEQEDRYQNHLATVPSNYTAVFQQYGAAYPFLDIANKYVVSGSFFFPDQLTGRDWTQVAQLLSSNNIASSQIITATNAITAAICKVTPSAPSSVCGNGPISALTTLLTAYHQSPGASIQAGTPVGSPLLWAKVQYGEMAWSTKSCPSETARGFC